MERRSSATQAMHSISPGIRSGMVFLKPGSRLGLKSLSAPATLPCAAVLLLCMGMDWEQERTGTAALQGISRAALAQKNRLSHAGACVFLCPSVFRHIPGHGHCLPIPVHQHIFISSPPGCRSSNRTDAPGRQDPSGNSGTELSTSRRDRQDHGIFLHPPRGLFH